MHCSNVSISSVLSLIVVTVCVGCANDEEQGAVSDPMDSVPAMTAPDGGETGDALSSEDQALVDAQVICPVSKGELGSMGTPVKVMVEGQPVFICCDHCKDPLLEEPAKYLQVLADAKAEREAAEKTEAAAGDSEPTT